jgi:lipopolysaccharide/colanic/teichoic acid biosynthesis glycosyltransferase
MKYDVILASLPFRRRSESVPDVQSPTGGFLKRGFDVVVACAGLILLSPLFIMLALLVKLQDGGAIFHGHRRIGQNGRVFRCLKFRTMVENGDEVLARRRTDHTLGLGGKRLARIAADFRFQHVGWRVGLRDADHLRPRPREPAKRRSRTLL